MKTYHYYDAPLKVFGIPFFYETGLLRRVPDEVIAEVPSLSFLGKRCPGGRLCFRTDSPSFTVKMTLETLGVDIGMSLYACQSAQILIGDRTNPRYAGLVNPANYQTKVFEKRFCKAFVMEDITVFFPRNEIIGDIEISVEDGASVEAPAPYDDKPIVYYGSSITEGGCCCNVFNAYNAILSGRLNMDYYNLGFSGSARGELAMADYINTFDMSIFVYDYDHNAPTAEHLRNTHEPFFLRIREKHPDLPVIMMSKPAETYSEDDILRREIIRTTYEKALAAGDKNVYFIDGETFYGEKERSLCSIDCIHPNDLGFLRMADTIEPVMRRILGK